MSGAPASGGSEVAGRSGSEQFWCYHETEGSRRDRRDEEIMTITAKYEDGVFKPLEAVSIDDGTIVEVRLPSCGDRLKTKSRSVRDFAFFGMWKDRTDMDDSVGYISNLRRDI